MSENTPNTNDPNERLDRLEESLKEREISFLRALKTLFDDYQAFQEGKREKFPKAALWGLVFAYMRPRLIVTVAGIAAVALGVLQIWLLTNQNKLINQQNALVEMQAQSNFLQTFDSLVSKTETPEDRRIAMIQLANFGEQGFELMYDFINYDTRFSELSVMSLGAAMDKLTDKQISRVLAQLPYSVNSRLNKLRETIDSRWNWFGGRPKFTNELLESAFFDFMELSRGYRAFHILAGYEVSWDALDSSARREIQLGSMLLLRGMTQYEDYIESLSDEEFSVLEENKIHVALDFEVIGNDISSWCNNDIGSQYREINWLDFEPYEYMDAISDAADKHCPEFQMFR